MDNKVLDIEQWEDYLYTELTRMGISITEELIMLITEISLEHFEDKGIVDFSLNIEGFDG